MSSLALRFPFLQLEALNVDIQQEHAVVISARNTVTAATPMCLQKGVELGMPVSAANMVTRCKNLARDAEKESALLGQICDALYAFTPYIERYCPNEKDACIDQGLLLELSRCVRLFGGLDPLVEKIISAMTQFGVTFNSALSHSGRAAWLLSYLEQEANLDDVDVGLLDEYSKEAQALRSAGFRTLKDIRSHVEKEGIFSFQKRFSPDFINYLKDILLIDQEGLGHLQGDTQLGLFSASTRQKPLTVYQPKVEFSELIEFDFPVTSIELLYEPMKTLLRSLCHYLVATQQQCTGITWRFSDIYHNETHLDVRSERIYRDWQLLFELSQIRLENLGLPFEVDQIELQKPVVESAHFELSRLDENMHTDLVTNRTTNRNINRSTNRSTELVMAKIQARVGEQNVFKVSSSNSHIPELAQQKVDVARQANTELFGEHRHAERPPWLLNEPVFIGEHQNNLYWHGRIQIIRGPEKLAAHWWGDSVEREYFIAVREDHVRLWVFNDMNKQEWRVQGVF